MDLIFSIFPILFFLVFGIIFATIISTLIKQSDHARTIYYATFQFPSGDRLELEIPNSHFGYLVEGDRGDLTFQGTRFLDFQRK